MTTKDDDWRVHINDELVNMVAPSVEAAMVQAFAKYWEKYSTISNLNYGIQVLNLNTKLSKTPTKTRAQFLEASDYLATEKELK